MVLKYLPLTTSNLRIKRLSVLSPVTFSISKPVRESDFFTMNGLPISTLFDSFHNGNSCVKIVQDIFSARGTSAIFAIRVCAALQGMLFRLLGLGRVSFFDILSGIGYGFCLVYGYNLVFLVWDRVDFGRCRSGISYAFC